MNNCILFIDGENFLHKVREVFKLQKIDRSKFNLAQIDLNKLFAESLKEFPIKKKIFYASKLHSHPDTAEKSEELIHFQRALRNNLAKQGFQFLLAGNVRAQKNGDDVVFREKGVDVKIAVDLVAMSHKKSLDCAILCSSDSDLQPAIAETQNQKVQVVYLGFKANPNKGLKYTCDKTILLTNEQIVASCPKI